MSDRGIGLVLFDLGGVLVEVGGVAQMRALTGIASDTELWERWLTSPWVRRFERGHCSPDEFAAGMVAEWPLALAPGDFLRAMQTWMSGPMPGVDVLLDEVRQVLPIGCLSNMNTLHWDVLSAHSATFDAFTYRFLSFQLGMVKPDRELFEHIASSLPVARDRVLFLDDNAMNVDAAKAAGFGARRVQGVDEARGALVEAGVLDS